MTRLTSDAPDAPFVLPKRRWPAAWRSVRRLMADENDTEQVLLIMDALNGDESVGFYRKLVRSRSGGLHSARIGGDAIIRSSLTRGLVSQWTQRNAGRNGILQDSTSPDEDGARSPRS